jgi:TPR repeat protein
MYYLGEGVTKDLAEAVKWFILAAQQGNENAQVIPNRMGLWNW